MPRAGSTLLARELDRREGVGVGIEESLPDGIVWGEPVKIRCAEDLDRYLNRAYHDEKLRAWGVSKEGLREKLLADHAFPIEIRDVLRALLSLYFGDSLPGCVIHKKGPYYRHIEKVRKHFPGSGIILIDRDPRAIYNSQKQALRSDSGKPMAGSLSTFAFQYLESQQVIRRYASEGFLCVVDYEQLLKDPSGVITRLLDFLGVAAGSSVDATYESRIPSAQQHLHANVGDNMMKERIGAWEEELGGDAIFFLQKALKRTLRRRGYVIAPVRWREVTDKPAVAGQLAYFYVKYTVKCLTPGFYVLLKRLLGRQSMPIHE